jgi:hypothetical protein
MQDTKIGHFDRQFFVALCFVFEHEAVAWTIHRLEAEHFVIVLEEKQVVFVVLIMATSLPQVNTAQIGGDDFFKAALFVLSFHKVKQFIVNNCSLRQEKWRSGRHIAEEIQFLGGADQPMVTFARLLLLLDVLGELLLRWE